MQEEEDWSYVGVSVVMGFGEKAGFYRETAAAAASRTPAGTLRERLWEERDRTINRVNDVEDCIFGRVTLKKESFERRATGRGHNGEEEASWYKYGRVHGVHICVSRAKSGNTLFASGLFVED